MWKNSQKKYNQELAIKTVENYYDVLEQVGWFCLPKEWAEKLEEVISNGITPIIWEQNLEKIDKHKDFPEI